MPRTKMSQIDSYDRIKRKRARIATIVILVLLALAILIGAVSYYGDHVGDYVISVERNTQMSLSLCENDRFEKEDIRTVLTPQGVSNQTNVSYFDIPLTDVNNSLGGQHSDTRYRTYFAYTFFLKNTSTNNKEVDYDIEITIRRATRGVDEAIRIMLIRNRNLDEGRWVFAKRARDEDGNRVEGDTLQTSDHNGNSYESTVFQTDTQVCNTRINAFPPGDIDSYTVVMWLEGDDSDCIDSIKGGTIMLDMEFSIVD